MMKKYGFFILAFLNVLWAGAQTVEQTDTLAGAAVQTVGQQTESVGQTAKKAVAATEKVVKETIRFGYLSYSEVLKAMPEYAKAMAEMDTLKAAYNKEVASSEVELNKRFIEYINGQKQFPENILLKRQKELQLLLDQSIEFKDGAQRLLLNAEKKAMEPVHKRLNEVLNKIGKDRGYAFILNTDNNSCPFVNDSQGEDITDVALTILTEK